MATFVISLYGQDGREVYAKARQNGRNFKKTPNIANATTYPTANAAAAAFASPHPRAKAVKGTKQTS